MMGFENVVGVTSQDRAHGQQLYVWEWIAYT